VKLTKQQLKQIIEEELTRIYEEEESLQEPPGAYDWPSPGEGSLEGPAGAEASVPEWNLKRLNIEQQKIVNDIIQELVNLGHEDDLQAMANGYKASLKLGNKVWGMNSVDVLPMDLNEIMQVIADAVAGTPAGPIGSVRAPGLKNPYGVGAH